MIREKAENVEYNFSAMMYEMIGLNIECRYKILGNKIEVEGETIYIFDLLETEIYLDIKGKRSKRGNVNQEEQIVVAKEIQKRNRTPFYPEEWEKYVYFDQLQPN